MLSPKARDEKERQELAMKSSDDTPVVASLATRHFSDQQVKKAQEIDALRLQVKDKEQIEPLPTDYFTKLGDAKTAAKAKSLRKSV